MKLFCFTQITWNSKKERKKRDRLRISREEKRNILSIFVLKKKGEKEI